MTQRLFFSLHLRSKLRFVALQDFFDKVNSQ
jgi:hypothetical protein